jgi:hypothetical protein
VIIDNICNVVLYFYIESTLKSILHAAVTFIMANHTHSASFIKLVNSVRETAGTGPTCSDDVMTLTSNNVQEKREESIKDGKMDQTTVNQEYSTNCFENSQMPTQSANQTDPSNKTLKSLKKVKVDSISKPKNIVIINKNDQWLQYFPEKNHVVCVCCVNNSTLSKKLPPTCRMGSFITGFKIGRRPQKVQNS